MRKKHLLLALLLLPLVAKLTAQPGTPDLAFGTNGWATVLVGTGPDLGGPIAGTPDGKILQAGSTVSGVWGYYHFAVARYLADGQQDNSFGNFGTAVPSPLTTLDCFAHALAQQSDQKILVAGEAYEGTGARTSATVLRLRPDGALDIDSFGFYGQWLFYEEFEQDLASTFRAVSVLPDDKILLAGSTCDFEGACAVNFWRLTANGQPDSTFGLNGRVLDTWGGATAQALAMAVQNDQKIVLVGQADSSLAVVRYLPGGVRDSSFGQNGVFLLDLGAAEQANAVLLPPDGRILVAGHSSSPANALVFRLLHDGTPDPAFGAQGVVWLGVAGQHTQATALALQADQKILIGGQQAESANSVERNWTLTRLLPDGTFDPSFGQNGRVVAWPASVDASVGGLVVQPGGRIVAGGYAFQSFALAGFQGLATSATETVVDATAVRLFPNPAVSEGQFFVKNEGLPSGRYLCRVTDLAGRTLLSHPVQLSDSGVVNVGLPDVGAGGVVVELSQNGRIFWRNRLAVLKN